MIFSGFFSALAFLTVLPIPQRWKAGREGAMFYGYPAAGLFIGALLGAAGLGAFLLFPPLLASGVLVGLTLLLTGAIHLDGLADCADAFYAGHDRESVLRILKDPRVGTMGAAAIGLSLLLRAAAFSAVPTVLLALSLPVVAMLTRGAVLAGARILPYVRQDSGIITARATEGRGLPALAAAAFLIALALIPVPVAVAAAGWAVLWRLSWRRIGGCTGDVLGATIEVGEVSFFVALAAMEKAGLQWGLLYAVRGLLP